jgi:WD40 repeat protein
MTTIESSTTGTTTTVAATNDPVTPVGVEVGAVLDVTLKWNKHVFSMTLHHGENSSLLKRRVEETTGVPMARQKLLLVAQPPPPPTLRGCWKGPLKDNVILRWVAEEDGTISEGSMAERPPSNMVVVTLIGSAEPVPAAPNMAERIRFVEDLSPEEREAEDEAQFQAALETAEGMIPALQFPPHQRGGDHGNNTNTIHLETLHQYNRLVSGLPQRQIEQTLKMGQGAHDGELQGTVAMTLGLELRRAYVNDIAVLYDGTCVSVLEDGHVQLWKHGAQQHDAVHAPGAEGEVTSIVALRPQKGDSPVAFATVGRGALYLWSVDGDPVLALSTGIPGTTPDSLVAVFGGVTPTSSEQSSSNPPLDHETITCLASRFQVTRFQNPSQFRLVPQNDEERRRRAHAEAQERAVQQALTKASHSIQIWYSIRGSVLQSKIVELIPSDQAGSAAITCLEVLVSSPPDGGKRFLVAGDTYGRLWIWKAQPSRDGHDIDFEYHTFYQILPHGYKCAIVCIRALRNGRLALSTDLSSSTGQPNHTEEGHLEGVVIPVDKPRSVTILDVSRIETPRIIVVLGGHEKDAVICMCQLPNGDLVTGGGKHDATLQLWSRKQIEGDEKEEQSILESRKTLTDVGYVFALTVLPDGKVGSNYYAIAAARYNTVKLVI